MTVSSIVQGLLEKGHITAEEAVILLKAEINKPCCPINPFIPVAPYNPPSNPFKPYCDPTFPNAPQIWYTSGTGNTGPNSTLNDNLTSK
jgi:hypothetical protein